MASGIASPWGESPQMVGGLNNSLDYGNSHLTGQLSLTSTPSSFDKKGQFISALSVQNKSFYSAPSVLSFGKKKASRVTLKSVHGDMKYLKKK